MNPGSARRVAGALVCCLALVAAGIGPAAGGTAPAGLSAGPGGVDADDVAVRIAVAEDGTATWAVEYRVRLDDGNATAAFDALRDDVRANGSDYRERFGRRLGATVDAAAETTGREMTLRNVSVGASVEQLPRRYGVVTYRFEWTGFAGVDGDRLRIGDAIDGLFLDEDTRLLVAWPEGYALRSAAPEPDGRRERTAVWSGPTEFGREQPRLVAERERGLPAWSADAVPALGGLGVAAVAVGAVAVGLRRRGANRNGGAVGDDAGASGEDAPADGTGSDLPPTELLSSEERVVNLLERNGGRMKQRAVAEALDWSDARASQVVVRLRDEGTIESFRLGRENVLSLPDRDGDGNADDR